MSPEQLSLIRVESQANMFRSSSFNSILQTKDHLSHASPLSVVPDVEKSSGWKRLFGIKKREPIKDKVKTTYEAWVSSRVAMTSRMTFFNDRLLSPDIVRAMAICKVSLFI